MLGNSKFGAGAVEIEVTEVEMRGESQVRLPRIRSDAKGGVYCSIRQIQTSGRPINFLEVERDMGRGEPVREDIAHLWASSGPEKG